MVSEPAPLSAHPTPEAIEAVLAFLPFFADPSNTFYEVDDTAGLLFDPYRYAPQVVRFEQVLYESGFLPSAFDWPAWQETAEGYVTHPDRLASADITTLRRLLLTHVRKARFVSGHLASMIDCGHILAVLQRLDALHRGGITRDTAKAP
jgi:hypothetical protein